MASECLYSMLYDLIDSFPKELISMVIDYCCFAPVQRIDKYDLPKSDSSWNTLLIICEQPFRAVLDSGDDLYFITAGENRLITLDDISRYKSPIWANDHGFFVFVKKIQIQYHDINPSLNQTWVLKRALKYESTIIRLDENTLIVGRHILNIKTGKFNYNKWKFPVLHVLQNGNMVVEEDNFTIRIVNKSDECMQIVECIGMIEKIFEDNKKLYIYYDIMVGYEVNEILKKGILGNAREVKENYVTDAWLFEHGRQITAKDCCLFGKILDTDLTWTEILESKIMDIQSAKDGIYVLTKQKIWYFENWLI